MFWRGSKNCFVQNRNFWFFFQNVELGELITNHLTCNYLTCIVTEIFGSLFSLCIKYFNRGGLKKFFVQNRNFFFQNVELVELITNQPTWNYSTCTVFEIFVSVFSLCIVFFKAGLKKFFVQNRKFFCSECRASRANHNQPYIRLCILYRFRDNCLTVYLFDLNLFKPFIVHRGKG